MKIQSMRTTYSIQFLISIFLINSVLLNDIYASDSSIVEDDRDPILNLQQTVVTGTITSAQDGMPIPGVNVLVKGNPGLGAVTDFEGNYSINVPSTESVLVFSYVGFVTVERQVNESTEINIALETNETSLEEVVVVGYGKQKKETVVGSVAQVEGEQLQRTGGVSNLGSALTGNLPGLITTSSSGAPGADTPQIFIRGQNSWNGNSPLILVDGVERPEFFSQMDIGSVESISVLKDAASTAVFGSRGANGVIIVTTKRGRTGKAEVTARASSTVKVVSKLPGKFDAYDAIGVRNRAIERELSSNPEIWGRIIPQEIRERYRNPLTLEDAERYPNVDWQDVLFKDRAMAYNANVAIRGGTPITKYFASIDFQNEQDVFQDFNNSRGYDPGFDYNRLNFRSNLDFQLTPTTVFQVDLGGTYGIRKTPWNFTDASGFESSSFWASAYNTAPDAYLPRYSDGLYGYPGSSNASLNSYRVLAVSGLEYTTQANLTSNFIVEQELDMITEGLKFRGALSVDNRFVEVDRGVNDLFNDAEQKFIDPETGQVILARDYDTNTRFDYFAGQQWNIATGTVQGAQRRFFYQFRLNYDKTIAEDHSINLLGLFSRQQDAIGSMIPTYREDWVFDASYSYKGKYLLNYSGAYNGSEKFAPDLRFAFFSSGGIGWVVSEEKFMESIKPIDFLKFRASYGQVGDDNIGGRFLFQNQWAFGESSQMGVVGEAGEYSPYTWYRESRVGNPSVKWETVYKYNLGMEFKLFKGLINGEIDLFRDNRVDILMAGDRAIPSYYGTTAPAANLGRVQTEGYEIQLGFNHFFTDDFRLYGSFAMTHAIDEVYDRDDPELLPDYQKQMGYQLGQNRTHISQGFYNSWDELYGGTPYATDNQTRLPGNYHLVDINGDGIIDNFDSAPFGYSNVPQNTFNTNIGAEWKGLSLFLQFYGVNNVTRSVPLRSLANQTNVVYDEGSYWSVDNQNADSPLPRWSPTASYFMGSRYSYDASYLRLKNAEIAYRFNEDQVGKLGLSALRLFLNGNNLIIWSKMPDDRESNFSGGGGSGAYPLVRRFNLGLNITF